MVRICQKNTGVCLILVVGGHFFSEGIKHQIGTVRRRKEFEFFFSLLLLLILIAGFVD